MFPTADRFISAIVQLEVFIRRSAPAWTGIIQMQRNVISADEVRTNGTAFFESLEISSVCFPDFEQNAFASAIMSVLTTIPGTAKPPALCFVIMYALFPI
jgi:hypothetical protein